MPNSSRGVNRPNFALKLGRAIERKGVSQADVARHFKVTPPTVSSDWLDHGRIAKEHIPELVAYFGLPYEWWFGPPDMPIPGDAPPEADVKRVDKTDENVVEISSLWEYVAPHAQNAILAFMRASKEASRHGIKDRGHRMPLGPADRSEKKRETKHAVEKTDKRRG